MIHEKEARRGRSMDRCAREEQMPARRHPLLSIGLTQKAFLRRSLGRFASSLVYPVSSGADSLGEQRSSRHGGSSQGVSPRAGAHKLVSEPIKTSSSVATVWFGNLSARDDYPSSAKCSSKTTSTEPFGIHDIRRRMPTKQTVVIDRFNHEWWCPIEP